jgi:biopolymer transport protein ExbB/TolQ
MVAVPAVMLYNHFLRRMNVMLTVAENHARTIRLTAVAPSTSSNVTARAA